MSKQKDIEYEMSKFEEEIGKLIPPPPPPSSDHANGAPPAKKQLINIQIPSSLRTTSTAPVVPASYTYPAPFISQPFGIPAVPLPTRPPPTQPTNAPIPPTPTSTNVKRDSSGNLKPAKIVPTTAAAAATAVAAAAIDMEIKAKKAKDSQKKKKFIRAAGGQTWEDDSLADWDPDDFRLFCGDLGNEVNDESLGRAFQKYPSFLKAKVVRCRRTGKSKGYGFVSFKNSDDFIKAMREMDGKYVGNRPIKLRKSNWKDRNLDIVKRKEAEKQKMGLR